MVNLSDLSGGGSSGSSSGSTKIDFGYGGGGTVAHYVMTSRNSSSGGYGFTFFDQDFGSVAWGANAYTDPQYQSISHWQNWQSGVYANYQALYSGVDNSASNSGSSNSISLSGMQTNQWGGYHSACAYSTGALHPRMSNSTPAVMQEMKSVFNSDHTNKAIAYQLQNGKIRAVPYNGFGGGNNSVNYPDTKDWSVPGQDASHDGTASYNKSLKKLFVVRSVTSSTAVYNCYSGVDFDKYPSPYEAMEDSAVTVVSGNMQLSSFSNNSESKLRMVPVLCDDGTVWIVCFNPSSGVKIWGRIAVPTADGDFSPTYIGNQSTTTSYGFDQGQHWGRTMLESRDRKGILVVAPYYYYGSGCVGYAVPKNGSSTNHAYAQINNTGSSSGAIPLPWRDDGFCFYIAGNGYASNWNGVSLNNFMSRSAIDSQGGYVVTTGPKYLPYFGLPNTTNYPGMSAVTDYALLSYNNGVR